MATWVGIGAAALAGATGIGAGIGGPAHVTCRQYQRMGGATLP